MKCKIYLCVNCILQAGLAHYRARYPGCRFVVATDDLAWVRARLGGQQDLVLPAGSPQEDLAALVACNHSLVITHFHTFLSLKSQPFIDFRLATVVLGCGRGCWRAGRSPCRPPSSSSPAPPARPARSSSAGTCCRDSDSLQKPVCISRYRVQK